MESAPLLDCLPLAGLTSDGGGRIRAANARAETLFRATPGALAGSLLAELFPDEAELDARLAVAACGDTVRLHARRRNGVPFSVDLDGERTPAGDMLWVLRELRSAALLRESQRYLDVAFERAPVGMALFNTDGQYVRVNEALCAMLGREPQELIGRRDQELTHPDDRRADVDAAWRVLHGELDTWQCEKRFVARDGSIVWAIASLAFLRDDEGRPLAWLGQFQDITAQKLQSERLEHLAGHDPLTGVANRRRLIAELERRLAHAGRHGERGAVLLLDLDGFKAVNDCDGHASGDRVLTGIAAALERRMRATDLLGRLGGDEFAAVVTHVDAEGARVIARDLLATVRDHADGTITASCGIALYGPDRAGDADLLLAEADRAMYQAKAAGRDRALVAGEGARSV